MDSLAAITHLILDMDGVLYRGNEPMPRLGEFFAFLRERRIPFMLVTNNATRTPRERAEKLAGMGVAGFALRDPGLRPGGGPLSAA